MDNQDKKRELIIEAALKRFAHFGLAKTTMTEIASDISLSKALLYYYFPDKISLYAAVLEHLINEVDAHLSAGVLAIKNSEEALVYFLDKRHEFIQKYYNLIDYLRTSAGDLPESIVKILEKAKNSEVTLIASVLKNDTDNTLNPSEAQEAAFLLMDAFMGMRHVAFSNKMPFQLSNDVFQTLLDRQKKLSTIFIKGLRK